MTTITVGRIVHYRPSPGRDGAPVAAIVTQVWSEGVVSICCFNPMPMYVCPEDGYEAMTVKQPVRFVDKDNPQSSTMPSDKESWPGDYGWCEYPPES